MSTRKLFLGISAALLAAAPLAAQTYTTADPPAPIPDNSGSLGTCQTINVPSVPGGDVIGTVTVSTSVAHSWVGDLTLQLNNPGGTSNLTVLNRAGRLNTGAGNPANVDAATPITYDDAAGQSAEDEGENPPGTQCASTQVVGVDCGPASYIPAPDATDTPIPGVGTNLAQYTGSMAPGIWMLCVGDSAGADTGTLSSWSITFTGNTPVQLMDFDVK